MISDYNTWFLMKINSLKSHLKIKRLKCFKGTLSYSYIISYFWCKKLKCLLRFLPRHIINKIKNRNSTLINPLQTQTGVIINIQRCCVKARNSKPTTTVAHPLVDASGGDESDSLAKPRDSQTRMTTSISSKAFCSITDR